MNSFVDYKVEYDRYGRVIFFQNLESKHWFSKEYNSRGKVVYHEDSLLGVITNHTTELNSTIDTDDYVSLKFFADSE